MSDTETPTQAKVTVEAKAEIEQPYTLMVRESDAEMPISFPTGATKEEWVRPRERGSMSGYERRQEATDETANMFLNEKPAAGTILEIKMPKGDSIFLEVRDPLARLSAADMQKTGVMDRRQNSVFVQRMPSGETTEQKVAAARQKDGGIISYDAVREEKPYERTGEVGEPVRPPELGMTSRAVLSAKRQASA